MSDEIILPNKAFPAERKKPRPLKSDVHGDWRRRESRR
jgi:hypothetical protein